MMCPELLSPSFGVRIGGKIGMRNVDDKFEISIPQEEALLEVAGFKVGDMVSIIATNGVLYIEKLYNVGELPSHQSRRQQSRSRRKGKSRSES